MFDSCQVAENCRRGVHWRDNESNLKQNRPKNDLIPSLFRSTIPISLSSMVCICELRLNQKSGAGLKIVMKEILREEAETDQWRTVRIG